jgi:nucleoside-diphosphate-sugar epimerase
MKSVHSISILGCGWLGLPLADHLIKEGFKVKGSVTKQEKLTLLERKGIIPFHLHLTDVSITGSGSRDFFDSDLLIINIPPGRKADVVQYHKAQIQQLTKAISGSTIKQVIFISSSAVYPDLNREMVETESSPALKNSGKALLEAESILRSEKQFVTTVIRFCGLIGPGRHPGKFLAGKKEVTNGGAPVNLIHRDDCIALISGIIRQQAWGELFNACADLHPSRKEFYTKAITQLELEVPAFSDEKGAYKIINSHKIKKRLAYAFKYPDPLKSLNHFARME